MWDEIKEWFDFGSWFDFSEFGNPFADWGQEWVGFIAIYGFVLFCCWFIGPSLGGFLQLPMKWRIIITAVTPFIVYWAIEGRK